MSRRGGEAISSAVPDIFEEISCAKENVSNTIETLHASKNQSAFFAFKIVLKKMISAMDVLCVVSLLLTIDFLCYYFYYAIRGSFPEFYSNISAGHFVVTAAAGHDYEFDRATSSVSHHPIRNIYL